MVATSVLPSPVSSSAMQRLWMAMPPTICTSNWRWPIARLAASRTRANASTSRLLSESPCRARSRRPWARALQLFGAQNLIERLECVDPFDQNGVAAQPAGMGRSGELLNSIQPRWAKATGHGVSYSSSVWHHGESPGTALFHQFDRARGTRAQTLRYLTGQDRRRLSRYRRFRVDVGRDPDGRSERLVGAMADRCRCRTDVLEPASSKTPSNRPAPEIERGWSLPSGGVSPTFPRRWASPGFSAPGASPHRIAAPSALSTNKPALGRNRSR